MNGEKRVRVEEASGKKIWIFLLVFSMIVLAIGVYRGFIKSAGYVKTTGVVVSLREETQYDTDTGSNRTYYFPTVSYNVDGEEYTGELDIGSGYSIGEELKIQYDPQDPSKVNSDTPVITIIIFVICIPFIALSVFRLIKESKAEQQ